MCGLVGCAGDLNVKHERAFKQLLILDSLRGEDSTGVAFVQKFSGAVTVAKQLGDPFALFQDNRFVVNMGKLSRALIGHNRYATSGGVSRATAHPFDFDTLVGVHNGTLNSKHALLDSQDYKVDSQNLYHHIEQKGLDDALSKLGGENNAWALVWWDKIEESINLLRNKQRPLYLCRTKDGKVLFWASESWMLHAVLPRNEVEYGDVVLLDEDKLFSVKIDNKGEMDKPTVRRAAAPYFAPTIYPPAGTVWKNQQSKTVVHVVGEAKKSGEVLTLSLSSLEKGASLEILVVGKDRHGAEFLSLFNPKKQFDDIRLYLRPDNQYLKAHVGKTLTGDVTEFVKPDGMGTKGYFKVSPHTVVLVKEPKVFSEEEVEAALDELNKNIQSMHEPDNELYMTAKGHLVSKVEWKAVHKDCAWCGSPLEPEDNNAFTTEKECLCPSCSKNTAALEYVTLKDVMH